MATRLWEQITVHELKRLRECEAKAALVPELVAALEAIASPDHPSIHVVWRGERGDHLLESARATLARAKAVLG